MKYKYELHTHTKYGSRQCGRTEPKDIERMYKENGYSGIVLTDHYSPLTFDLAHGYFNPKKFIDCYIDPYLEMKKYEEYYTREYWEYAQMIKEDNNDTSK